MATTFRERMLDYQAEVFGPTVGDLLRWVATTRPRPTEEEVDAHVRRLRDEGLITPSDVEALAARGYEV